MARLVHELPTTAANAPQYRGADDRAGCGHDRWDGGLGRHTSGIGAGSDIVSHLVAANGR
jgi:hypothetical protein